MSLGLQALEAARGMIDTPFHHQGRKPGVGLDCVGLLVAAARAIGYPIIDCPGYSPDPRLDDRLIGYLKKNLDPVEGPREAGDVLVLKLNTRKGSPCHVGLLSAPGRILHAYLPARRVLDMPVKPKWWGQIHSVWRWRDG